MNNDKEWISVKEAAAIRNVSERVFLNLIRDKKVEAHKEGRSWKVDRESVEKLSEDIPKDPEIVSLLKAQLQEAQDRANRLEQELSDTKKRADTIIMGLTQQNQLMLEDKTTPWYRKLFRKKENQFDQS
jgi:excisionase family DNA binding protein